MQSSGGLLAIITLFLLGFTDSIQASVRKLLAPLLAIILTCSQSAAVCSHSLHRAGQEKDRSTKLEEREKQLEAPIQQIKARHSQRQRKADTRRKILVGSYYLARAERENRMEELKRAMDKYLTRKLDRLLFDLPPLPESASSE